MTLKKTSANKRTLLPRATDYTKTFLKDWEHLLHSGRYDMNKLKEAMMLLTANDAPLPHEWLDHSLTGNWQGYRECHIGGDFLLIYKLIENSKFSMIVFTRAGTHSELFA